MLKSVRRESAVAAWLLLVASPWLAACGGRQEVVERPPAAKVVWGNGEGTAAAEESEPAETKASDESAPSGAAAPMEIDLDAKPTEAAAESEPAEPAESKPAARSKREPEPEPEPEAAAEEPEISSSAPVAELQKRRQQKEKAADKAKGGKGKTASKAKAASKPKSDDAGDAEPAPAKASYSGGDACRAASFSVPRVRDACASGGRSAAKKVMKDAINKATATGQLLKCTTCHTNQVEYGLKSNAVADLKRWLEGS